MLTESPYSMVLKKDFLNDAHGAPEGLFRQCVEATPLGILVVNDQGVMTYVNKSLCEIFGYQSNELLGQPIEILVPNSIQGDHVRLRNAYLANPAQRLMQGREVRGRRRDGTEVAVAIGLNPLILGDTIKVACTVMDLSEIRQAEETLANFFELSLDLCCVASTQGYFVRINPSFPRLLGYSEQELLSRPFLDFVHPDDVAASLEAVAVLATGQPVIRFHNRYRTVQGNYRWVDWSARATVQDGMIYAVGRDVTEEMILQKELQARVQREEAILENTPAVVYVKDIAGKYVYANQRFVDLFALNRPAVLGKTDHEIFPAALADKFRENDRSASTTRQRITIEEKAPHQDGIHTYVSVKFPLLDAEGAVSAVAGISTDITENLRSQELQAEMRLATAFQRKLYPLNPPSIPGLDLAGAAVPASHLCGDYYDFIVTCSGKIVLAVGDVSGHGVGPALAMVEVRSILRGLLHYRSDTRMSQIVLKLNQLLCEDLPEARFVSLFLAEIDVPRGQLQYAGAGHQALLVRTNGKLEVLSSTAPVLGLLPSITVREMTPLRVQAGDALLICTDGVTEALNRQHQLFGHRRVAEYVSQHRHNSPEQLIQQIFSEVLSFTGDRGNTDDMTAVVGKMLPVKHD